MSSRSLLVTSVFFVWPPPWVVAQSLEPFTLKNGDRVLFVGSALIEHEQFHGYLETRLTARYPETSITFRNLGWSGDTVTGTARTGGFENPDGLARLLKEVKALKPTIIFIGYGMNESFGGPEGLAGFVQGFTALLDDLDPLKSRVIVLSPTLHEDIGRPFPDPAKHDQYLELYTAALEKLATQRKLGFVDLFHSLMKQKAAHPQQRLTSNGVLLNQLGYWLMAEAIDNKLCGVRVSWGLELDYSGKVLGKVLSANGVKVDEVKVEGSLRFVIRPEMLPEPPRPDGNRTPSVFSPALLVTRLPAADYVLRINGKTALTAAAAQWERGIPLATDANSTQTEQLRAAIVKKNRLFYRRWRPYNDHSRHWGFIGGDHKLYDAEIAQQETLIARLRRPEPLRCEIIAKAKAK